MLLLQMASMACSLAFRSTGISIAINKAMMAITTNSSIKVNPRLCIIALNSSAQKSNQQSQP
jgi:hypothetical protein